MEEIIDWLIQLEKQAGDFYYDAAEYFQDDEMIKDFLLGAAEDEAWHFHVMGSAKTQLGYIEIPETALTLTDSFKDKVEQPFNNYRKKLENKTLDRQSLLDCVAETEFSEWNSLFRYIVNIMKTQIKQFYYSAAKIQHHMGRAQHFLEQFEYGKNRVDELLHLDRVFDENILIAEDDETTAELLEALLEDMGNITIAANGEEALARLDERYYKLIVSDINMPVMDGITFYNRAIAKFPNLENRFLFNSGYFTEEARRFFDERGIVYIKKPAPIEEITVNALKIMHVDEKNGSIR